MISNTFPTTPLLTSEDIFVSISSLSPALTSSFTTILNLISAPALTASFSSSVSLTDDSISFTVSASFLIVGASPLTSTSASGLSGVGSGSGVGGVSLSITASSITCPQTVHSLCLLPASSAVASLSTIHSPAVCNALISIFAASSAVRIVTPSALADVSTAVPSGVCVLYS